MAFFVQLTQVIRHIFNDGSALKFRKGFANEALALIAQGNKLEDAGLFAQAKDLYEQAVHIEPTLSKAHLNLGNVLLSLVQPENAILAYKTALLHQPDFAAAYFNIGNAQVACARLEVALEAYNKALVLNPNFVDAMVAQGNVLGDLGRYEAAIISYQNALVISPNYLEVQINLAIGLRLLGRLDDAAMWFNKALALKPDRPDIHHNLGLVYRALGRLGDSVSSLAKAISIKPDFVAAYCDLANAYREIGDSANAIKFAQLARNLDPNESGVWSLLLFCLSNSQDIDPHALFEEHRRFGEHFEPQLRSNLKPHSNVRNPERVLKVGVVSADLRHHAVVSFFEPLLELLIKMPSLSIYIYNSGDPGDAVSLQLRSTANQWLDVYTFSDELFADRIREDAIDVLIDLNGHTPAHRLLTFARKPAPIQMSWIGYPGTTGLTSIDYYIGDRHFLPPEQSDKFFTEKILRIPANAPFQPNLNSPAVNQLPALINGFVTFASFNRIDKIGRDIIILWSRLMMAIPSSKMIMGGMPISGTFDQITDWFAHEGVTAERLIFYRRTSMADYLQLHHQVDICLDTFPYGGGTTTCHAMWMGVPTLTLAGATPASGVGRAILSHVDLQSAFCAKNQQEFVSKGLWCAEHLEYLQDLRLTLRERFQKSALSQPVAVASGLELAMRHAWRRWCADLPPVSFEVSHDSGQFGVNDPHPPAG